MNLRRVLQIMLVLGVFLSGCNNNIYGQKSGCIDVSGPLDENKGWVDVDDREQVKKEYEFLTGSKLNNIQMQGEDEAFYCNLSENIQGGLKTPVLVCPDPVYNITYFVNYGRDYLIYAIKNDCVELAVEIPARDLFCRDGELFFLVEDYGKFSFSGINDGDIVKYNPMDGSLECVISAGADAMIVYPDAIHYSVKKILPSGGVMYETKFFSMIENCEKQIEGICPERFQDYLIIQEKSKYEGVIPNGLEADAPYMTTIVKTKLRRISDGLEKDLPGYENLPLNGGLFNYRLIQNDFFYYEQADENEVIFWRYNVISGERENVMKQYLPEDAEWSPFLFTKGHVIFGDYLSYSSELDNIFAFNCIQNGEELKNLVISAFYSDGNNLFCIYDDVLYRMKQIPFIGEYNSLRIQMENGSVYEYLYGDISMELMNPLFGEAEY